MGPEAPLDNPDSCLYYLTEMVKKSKRGLDHESILDVALTHFGRYGYRRASLEDMARDLGVVKGALYYHVPEGKPGLFAAVAARAGSQVLETMSQAAESGADAGRALRAAVDAKLTMLHALTARFGAGREVVEEVLSLVRQQHVEYLGKERTLFESVLARGEREGTFRPVRSRRAAAAALQALLSTPVTEALSRGAGPEGLPPAVLDLILRGLEAKP